MAVLPLDGYDQDMMRLWAVIGELSEQLARNKALAAALLAQSTQVKAQSLHASTGFVLRRFNMNLSDEEYYSEVERMNNVLSFENQTLQYDNRQLQSLLREYEQTLDSVMTSFRSRAHDVQERELTLIRNYESELLSRETVVLDGQLAVDSSVSFALTRISQRLRKVVRLVGGEGLENSALPSPQKEEGVSQSEWALERDCELARLENENEELRRMVGIVEAVAKAVPARQES